MNAPNVMPLPTQLHTYEDWRDAPKGWYMGLFHYPLSEITDMVIAHLRKEGCDMDKEIRDIALTKLKLQKETHAKPDGIKWPSGPIERIRMFNDFIGLFKKHTGVVLDKIRGA